HQPHPCPTRRSSDLTATSGVASMSATGQTAGSVTVTASKSGLTSDTSTFSVTPGPATKLVFTSDTSSVASGSTKTLTAKVEDAKDRKSTRLNSSHVA